MHIGYRLKNIHVLPILVMMIIASLSVFTLFSAANAHFSPWASKQAMRFCISLILLISVALVDIRTWYTLSYPFYVLAFLFLIGVEVMGFVGMGAKRWLDLYIFTLQPSELMKIALILALARYFHDCPPSLILKNRTLLIPIMLILAPSLLVMRQPDLGTAMLLIFAGTSTLFLAGVQLWKFICVGGAVIGASPLLWHFLHDYQKNRILVFLNPEMDPSHTGYHVMQSKIALGSGGFWGKGFMEGSQGHLNFLPEKQTDFIFTMFCEEFGMAGALFLLSLYTILIVFFFNVALKSRSSFGRLLALSLTMLFFFYIFINISMVMGLVPVVGVPLPLMSYGGTSMITVMFSFGLIFSTSLYRDVRLGST